MYVYMYVLCMYVYMYVVLCMYVLCVYVCMYALCMYVCMYAHSHVHSPVPHALQQLLLAVQVTHSTSNNSRGRGHSGSLPSTPDSGSKVCGGLAVIIALLCVHM